MKLMTKAIENKFRTKYPLMSQDGKGMNADVVVKYFAPIGAGTWLITEANPTDDGDWEMFGYCTLFGDVWEWGYVMLSELQDIRLPYGLGIERDKYAVGCKVKDLCDGVVINLG